MKTFKLQYKLKTFIMFGIIKAADLKNANFKNWQMHYFHHSLLFLVLNGIEFSINLLKYQGNFIK